MDPTDFWFCILLFGYSLVFCLILIAGCGFILFSWFGEIFIVFGFCFLKKTLKLDGYEGGEDLERQERKNTIKIHFKLS